MKNYPIKVLFLTTLKELLPILKRYKQELKWKPRQTPQI